MMRLNHRLMTVNEYACSNAGFYACYSGEIQDRRAKSNPDPENDYPSWENAEQCLYDNDLEGVPSGHK